MKSPLLSYCSSYILEHKKPVTQKTVYIYPAAFFWIFFKALHILILALVMAEPKGEDSSEGPPYPKRAKKVLQFYPSVGGVQREWIELQRYVAAHPITALY